MLFQTLALILVLLVACHASANPQRPSTRPGWWQPQKDNANDDKIVISAVQRTTSFGDVVHARYTTSAYREIKRKAAVPKTELEHLEQVYGLTTAP